MRNVGKASIWDDDDSSDQDQGMEEIKEEIKKPEPRAKEPKNERSTRSMQLKFLVMILLLTFYSLVSSLIHTEPENIIPEKPTLDEPKVEPPINHVVRSKLDELKNNLDPYMQFVEKWYGTTVVISSSVEQEKIEGSEKKKSAIASSIGETESILSEVPTEKEEEKAFDFADISTQQVKLSSIIIEELNGRKAANEYKDITSYKPFHQLPFCLVITEKDEVELYKISKSLAQLKYKNFRLVFSSEKGKNIVEQFFRDPYFGDSYLINFMSLRKLGEEKCQEDAVIFPISSPLKPDALIHLNEIHQTYSAWVTYGSNNGKVQIYTFYRRIPELIEKNDFDKTNKEYFKGNDNQFMVIPFLELTKYHSYEIDKTKLVDNLDSRFLFSASLSSKVGYERAPYEPLLKMSQVTKINLNNELKVLTNMEEREDSLKVKEQYLSKSKLEKAMEYEELLYLPSAHSLNTREQADLKKSFKIEDFNKYEELPICLTVMSRNNAMGRRYEKSILSILKQDYSNYRIVFIDDKSNDDTLKLSMRELKGKDILSSKVTFIKNLEVLGPSFNILHTAYQYCGPNDIQVVMEGDDQLIGRQVFKFLNTLYQKNERLWLIYTSSFDIHLDYGTSRPLIYDSKLIDKDGNRVAGKYMGFLASWRTELIRKIPLSQFKTSAGKWLDSSYDVAMQRPLMEAATVEHIKYVPLIMYLKVLHNGRGYVANQQTVDKEEEKKEILVSPAMKPISDLTPDHGLEQEAKRSLMDSSAKFTEVTYSEMQL